MRNREFYAYRLGVSEAQLREQFESAVVDAVAALLGSRLEPLSRYKAAEARRREEKPRGVAELRRADSTTDNEADAAL